MLANKFVILQKKSMVFSSILFLFIFLPIFIVLYNISGDKLKNYTLLAASIIFYAWGAPIFIFVLFFSMIVNFHIVKHFNRIQKNRRIWLIIAIINDLVMLAYFKYSNFFVDNLNVILDASNMNTISWVKVALPVGISFFSFQSLTYTIDVYRKTHVPLQKLTDYMLYILMFPQLIAGPIVRFSMVANEIVDRKKNETIENKLVGFYRFSIGLAKKVLIANVLGEQVDKIYALPLSEIDSTLSWIAIIAYSFQIYFDFSGYSDIAIGLGKMIGFNFPENFNNP